MSAMTPPHAARSRLLAPLIFLAALLLLLEQWLWQAGSRAMAALANWPPLRALESLVARLPPYAALAVFILPALLLFPIKLLALMALAHGHPVWGALVFVLAKMGGTMLVARIYLLTLPSLMTLAWFARWQQRFIVFKDHCIARLHASAVYHHVRRVHAALRQMLRRLRRRLRAAAPFGGRSARALRRFVALWRRRHDTSKQEPP